MRRIRSKAPTAWLRRGGIMAVLLASVVGMLALTTAGSAHVDLAGSAPVVTAAGDPDHVSTTLEGCKNDGSITLPNGSGDFICPDGVYTPGNLGKGWNELDLVPYRVTLSAGGSAPATQTYTLAVVLDGRDAGHPGYDVISAPTLNTALSDASCTAPTVGPQLTTTNFGGIDESIYRLVTITQARGTGCVYDYYGRLALGSHLFPGSALHANLANQNLGTQGIGASDVSIPVNEIAPQELDKDMSASQGSDHVWDITKSPTPASVSFANTCNTSASRQAGVTITVNWTKEAATPNGPITVITHVYATNPAARTVTVNVSDQIYSGTTAIGSPATAGPIDLPANTANFLVLTHTTTVPDGTANLNDIATGTYTDKFTGIPIPGTTTATASAPVQLSGIELNQSATINDLESITGAGFQYSADSFADASGAFDNSYVAGTATTGNVSWTSDSQSGSGFVTFDKTIYVAAGTSSTGELSDTATLNGSDGFTTDADASVDISASAQVKLTIHKTIPNILQGSESQTFTFKVKDHDGNVVASPQITFGAGETDKTVDVNGLTPDNYTVTEDAATGWSAQDPQNADLNLPTCSGEVEFDNNFGPADAKAAKVTVPSGSASGWQMILTGPGTPAGGEKVLTDGSGNAPFTTSLQEGSYTITETPKAGWDQTGTSGDCSFTVNYPADSGRHFVCTITNTQRGSIIVKKVTNPVGAAGSFTFSGDAAGSISDGGTITVNNLVPGTYTSTEANPAPAFDLTGLSCNDGSSATASTVSLATRTATFKLDPGETVTCTFTNRQRGTIIVKKVTDPVGAAGTFAFTGTAAGSISDGGTITVNNLVPGTYTSTEADPTPAFDLTGLSCNDGSSATASTVSLATRTATFKLDPGETVTCTFTNRQRGKAKVVKTVNGSALSGTQSFTFQLRSGASLAAAGTILESGTANAGNGGIINFTTNLVPGTTYQLCEQMLPGWMTTLGPPLYSVYNPSGDNSVVCTDFTVTAGQTKTFSIDNKPPPGGMGLTIGFWKNWSSCTGGGQKPTLDQTLLKMAQASTPATLGLLVLNPLTQSANTVCNNAVSILSKQTLTGKKMSSDPLFNMAAQLLAADLNLGAGAGQCAASATAINQAHTLLSTYKFDGNGYTPKLTTADANLANSLATTLDKYNNNKLC